MNSTNISNFFFANYLLCPAICLILFILMDKKPTAVKKISDVIEIPIDEQTIRQQIVRIAISRADFRAEMPRFYRAFNYVHQYPNLEIPTMCVSPLYDQETSKLTGWHDFMWSPKFAKDLTDKQLMGVQMHELLHILLGHTTGRGPDLNRSKIIKDGCRSWNPKSPNVKEDMAMHELWNIASDLSINCMIKSYLLDSNNKKWTGDQLCFPGSRDFVALPEFKTAEWYFEELKKTYKQEMTEIDKFLKKLLELFGKCQVGSHGEWVDKDEDGKVLAGGKSSEKSEEKEEGDSPAEDETTADEIEKELDEIADVVGCGGQRAGHGGTTTKGVDLSAGKEKSTPGWMKKTTHASTHGFEVAPVATRKVPNRRYGNLFPGRKRVSHRNKCLIAVDVSGSIDRPKLNVFCEHLNKMKRFADFDLFFFNEYICHPQTGKSFTPDEGEKALTQWKTGMQFYTGGGTDFEPIMKFWNRVRVKYDTLFIFTDGQANYQTPPVNPKDVNWILYDNSGYYKKIIKHGNKYDMNEDPNHPQKD